MIVRTLKWPVICLLLIGSVHFIEELALPDLQGLYIPAVVGVILLVVGLWTGYLAVYNGGSFATAIVAGVVLGLLPLVLDLVGFGMILGRGTTQGLLAGVFGFTMVFFGSIIGGGFALSTGRHGV
jgi:hypothetical protein